MLVVDETGFLKKGTTSVGVQRQYFGLGRPRTSHVRRSGEDQPQIRADLGTTPRQALMQVRAMANRPLLTVADGVDRWMERVEDTGRRGSPGHMTAPDTCHPQLGLDFGRARHRA